MMRYKVLPPNVIVVYIGWFMNPSNYCYNHHKAQLYLIDCEYAAMGHHVVRNETAMRNLLEIWEKPWSTVPGGQFVASTAVPAVKFQE